MQTSEEMNRDHWKPYTSVICLILVAACVLVFSTIYFSYSTKKSSDDTTVSLGRFYLEEIADRNVYEISSTISGNAERLQNAVAELEKSDLDSEQSLRTYLAMVQRLNGLDIFAVVDEDGMVYTSDNTFSGISRFDFLSEPITETKIFTTRANHSKAMILSVTPTDRIVIGDIHIVSAFTGVDVEKIISVQQIQGKNNEVLCRLFNGEDGTCIVESEGRYTDGSSIFDVWENTCEFSEEYPMDTLISDWKNQKEGYAHYTAPEGSTYLYYKPVPGTNWMVSVRQRQSIITTQIKESGKRIFHQSLIQIAIVIIVLFTVFLLYFKQLQKNRTEQFEREKQEELLRQEHKAYEEKLQLQQKLLNEEQIAHRRASVLQILSREYSSAYYVNLKKDQVMPIRLSEDTRESLDMELEKIYSFKDFFEQYIRSHVASDQVEELLKFSDEKYLHTILGMNEAYTCPYRMVKNGVEKYAQLRVARVENDADFAHIVLGFAIVDKEVREEMEKQRALKDALAQAQHASRAKSNFLSNMSHDIRTPMNAIIGFTAIATTHIDKKERVLDCLQKIQTSSNHLLSLINDILDMSRIESGKVKIEENECTLPIILHDIKNIVQTDICAKQLEFFIDTIDVVHENVYCDKLRVNQVLLNCLSNAMKFTPPNGTISVRIRELPCQESGYAIYQFKIRDTGIGIGEEFIDHIFEPFERERNSTISGIQGTGLGLAITKNIVDMMNGKISVESEVGKGSEFTIELKLRLYDSEPIHAEIPELKNVHALVADDDYNTCTSVCKMLTTIGLVPQWTMSGKEAVLRVQYAKEQGMSFGVFIIDWLMPDMNGVEVVRRIRHEIGDETPIIILTAYDWSNIEEEAREAGVTAFCSKPLFLSELHELLLQAEKPVATQKEESETVRKYDGKRVLIVEDNRLNSEIAMDILSEAGIEADVAENGKIAVDMVKSADYERYDVILMDIQMPIMDGYTATEHIRSLPDKRKATIPIIAMTANAFDEDKKKAFSVGMNGHLAKPIDFKKLFALLEDIIENKSENREEKQHDDTELL